MTEPMTDTRVETLLPPQTLNFQFGAAWTIALPQVFRYEQQRWIDEFFRTGLLRLSTFAKFSTYEDEIRGDPEEGNSIGYGETAGGHSLLVSSRDGINCYVLCASHRLSRELGKKFGYDSAFQIMDTVNFAREISRQLSGFQLGLEGSCIYRSLRSIKRSLIGEFQSSDKPNGPPEPAMVHALIPQLGGPEKLLLKKSKYAYQQEYRLLWQVDKLAQDHIDIYCPNAVQYCRKVKADDYID